MPGKVDRDGLGHRASPVGAAIRRKGVRVIAWLGLAGLVVVGINAVSQHPDSMRLVGSCSAPTYKTAPSICEKSITATPYGHGQTLIDLEGFNRSADPGDAGRNYLGRHTARDGTDTPADELWFSVNGQRVPLKLFLSTPKALMRGGDTVTWVDDATMAAGAPFSLKVVIRTPQNAEIVTAEGSGDFAGKLADVTVLGLPAGLVQPVQGPANASRIRGARVAGASVGGTNQWNNSEGRRPRPTRSITF